MAQLVNKRGPFFERWYAGCRAVFEHERVSQEA